MIYYDIVSYQEDPMPVEPEYDALEAEKLGYDFKVVEFFRKVDNKLLGSMWGNNSFHYSGILTNTLTDEEVEASLGLTSAFHKTDGFVYQSAHLIKVYRIAREEWTLD